MSGDNDSDDKKPSSVYLVCYDGSAKSKLTLEFIKKRKRFLFRRINSLTPNTRRTIGFTHLFARHD
jgi:hypothetical protein